MRLASFNGWGGKQIKREDRRQALWVWGEGRLEIGMWLEEMYCRCGEEGKEGG